MNIVEKMTQLFIENDGVVGDWQVKWHKCAMYDEDTRRPFGDVHLIWAINSEGERIFLDEDYVPFGFIEDGFDDFIARLNGDKHDHD